MMVAGMQRGERRPSGGSKPIGGGKKGKVPPPTVPAFKTDLGDLVASSGVVGKKNAKVAGEAAKAGGTGGGSTGGSRKGGLGARTPRRAQHQGLAELDFFRVRAVLERELRRGGSFGSLQALVRTEDGRRWPCRDYSPGLKMKMVFNNGDELSAVWSGMKPAAAPKSYGDPGLTITGGDALRVGATPMQSFVRHASFPEPRARTSVGVRTALRRGGARKGVPFGGAGLWRGEEFAQPKSPVKGPPGPDSEGGWSPVASPRSPGRLERSVDEPMGPIGASSRDGDFSITILTGNMSHAGAGIV